MKSDVRRGARAGGGMVVPIGLGAVAVAIHTLMSRISPEYYMDEIFHIRQTQQYCEYHFEIWDPMITTFPGLYLLFLVYSHLISPFTLIFSYIFPSSALSTDSTQSSAFNLLCSVTFMRSLNLVLGIGIYFVSKKILERLHSTRYGKPERTDGVKSVLDYELLLRPILIFSFPVLFFFYFLFYTDAAATFFVLLCYFYSLEHSYARSALAGIVAIFCRQTNIVWVGFIAASVALARFHRKKTTRQRNLFDEMWQFSKYCLRNFSILTRQLWMYIAIALAFGIFVYLNKGIVVGDRTQHEARLHFPQLFYFVTFSSAWVWPAILLLAWRWVNSLRDRHSPNRKNFPRTISYTLLCAAVFVPVAAYLIKYYTYAHPYLLADNRHFTFYIWKNFFRRNEDAKYYYIPLYFASFVSLWRLLGASGRSGLWRLLYFVCVAATLIPAGLLEPRYFIIPHLFVVLHTNSVAQQSQPSMRANKSKQLEKKKKMKKKGDPEESRSRGTRAQLEQATFSVKTRHRLARPAKTTTKEKNLGRESNLSQNIGASGDLLSKNSSSPSSPNGILALTAIILELAGYIMVNVVTIWLFLYRPFLWPDGSIARWMW